MNEGGKQSKFGGGFKCEFEVEFQLLIYSVFLFTSTFPL